MSKVLLASTMAIGGASGAVGIAHLAGAFGNATSDTGVLGSDGAKTESDNVNYELPEKIDVFKGKNINKIGCIRDTFPSISSGTVESVLGSGNEMGNTESIQFSEQEGKSCLVVNWDKWKPSETDQTKWRGNFRFLWAFSKGNQGWVIYNYADTLAEDNNRGKARVNGGAYILKEVGGVWTSEKKLEVLSKELSKEAWTNESLPKPGTSLPGVDSNSFWGLFNGSLDENNLCKEGECQTPGGSFRDHWSWKEDGNHSSSDVGSWSSSVGTWWNAIYGTDKWDLNTYVSNFKGKWTKVES